MLNFIQDIEHQIENLDYFNDKFAYDKKQELTAMKIVAETIILFANRHADKLENLSKQENDIQLKKELEKIAKICRKVPANRPVTFHEALQYYWFVHVGVITELNP